MAAFAGLSAVMVSSDPVQALVEAVAKESQAIEQVGHPLFSSYLFIHLCYLTIGWLFV
jgi:NADH:ubiquinone oxidoreductase subunit 6 (subunit J)